MFKLTIHPPERVDGTLTRDYTFATQDDSRSAIFMAPPSYTTAEAREILLEALDTLNFDPDADVAEALGITSDKRRRWLTVAYAIESVVRPAVNSTGESLPDAPSTRELADRLAALASRVDGLAAALEQLRRPDTAALSPSTTDAQLLSMLSARGLDVRDVLRTACLRHRRRSWVPKGLGTPDASAIDYLRGWSLELDPDNAKQPAALPFVDLLRTIALVRDNFGTTYSRDELPELIRREAVALNGQGFGYHAAVPLVQRARLYSTFLWEDVSDFADHPDISPSDVLTIARRAQVFATTNTEHGDTP